MPHPKNLENCFYYGQQKGKDKGTDSKGKDSKGKGKGKDTKSDTKPTCNYCKKPGHLEADCWSKQGKNGGKNTGNTPRSESGRGRPKGEAKGKGKKDNDSRPRSGTPGGKEPGDCNNWMHKGECKYGDTCRFKHEDDKKLTKKHLAMPALSSESASASKSGASGSSGKKKGKSAEAKKAKAEADKKEEDRLSKKRAARQRSKANRREREQSGK